MFTFKKILFAFTLVSGLASAQSLTLAKAHRIATKQMERIGRSDQAVLQAQAEVRRRWSVVSPTLSLRASEYIQDTSGLPTAVTTGGGTVQNTLVRKTRPEVALNLHYTFFSGFREFAALSASKADVRSQKAQRERAEQLLYADVANVFYNVMMRDREIEVLKARDDVLGNRRKDFQHFEKIGRSRPSERVRVEADKKVLEADIYAAEGSLKAARALLAFYLGAEPALPLKDDAPLSVSTIPLLESCLTNISERPDLVALRETVTSEEKTISYERRAYWPTAEVESNYYLYRVGYQKDINWDVNLMLNFPFFQGGITKANIAIARAASQQAALALQESERQAKTDAQARHAILMSEVTRLESLREALKLEEENYRLQSKEYRLALVTNLDVLSALSDLYQTKLNVAATEMQAKTHIAELAVACGTVPTISKATP